MFMIDLQPTDGFEWTQERWGTALRCRPLLAWADHLFTTRDLRLSQEDEEEWRTVASALGVAAERLLLITQVHRADVAVVRRTRADRWTRPEADAIVTDDPQSGVAVRVADCAPILFADPVRGVVGAVHAGWRGTVHRAAIAAVEALAREFGSDPGDLVAAIGPCLGPCCAEVGSEVVKAFRDSGHPEDQLARWFTTGPGDRPYFDLWRANADQLESAGLASRNIHVARLCTKTHADVLHSYRADGVRAGRMVGAIKPR
jgi:YfiH family protein